jgi:hypothetical protein
MYDSSHWFRNVSAWQCHIQGEHTEKYWIKMQWVNNFKIDTLNSLYISRSPLPTDVFSCNIQHRITAVYADVISLFYRATVPLLRRLVITCHRGGSSAIPGRSIWDRSGQNDNGTGFSPNTPVLLVIIPPTFHTHVSFTYHRRYVIIATCSVFKLKKKFLFCSAHVSSGCLK